MARRNQPWNAKQWLPNAQSKKDRISALRDKYIKVKPIEKVNTNELLFSVGSSLVKQRAREGRPDIYNTFSLRSKWIESPIIKVKAYSEFDKLKQFYESKEYTNIKEQWKKIDSSIELPDESKVYKDIVSLRDLLKSKVDSDSIYEQSKKASISADIDEKMRIFFSRKISIPEFLQRWETVQKETQLILSLKKSGKFKGKSNDEYISSAYEFLREAIEKNKDSYSSDTIYTAVMSSGIDEFVDKDLESNDDLMDKFRESLESNFGEIQQLRQSILGDERELKNAPSFIRVDRERFKQLRDNDTKWGELDDSLSKEEFYNLTGISKINDIQKGELARQLPTIGDLKSAKELIKRATKDIKGNKYNFNNFSLASEVLDYKGDEYDKAIRLRSLIKSQVSDEFLEVVKDFKK